jgi:uncharacterized protein YijF (DUF1287 family)
MNSESSKHTDSTVDHDARIAAARAWCEDHARRVTEGRMTVDQAAGELLAGRLYDVDMGSAGFDMVVCADSEDEALELAAELAGVNIETAAELRAKFDPWSARLVTLGGAS